MFKKIAGQTWIDYDSHKRMINSFLEKIYKLQIESEQLKIFIEQYKSKEGKLNE